jgi:hypothetical protein
MAAKAMKNLAIAIVFAMVMGVGARVSGQSVSRELVVTRDAKVGDKLLSKGKYSISFDDQKDGELSVVKDGREVVKVNYKLVDLGKDASNSVVVFAAASDGSYQVRRIELKGTKKALQLE